jgi:D-sedoheptulose 7-phosphate isomerase
MAAPSAATGVEQQLVRQRIHEAGALITRLLDDELVERLVRVAAAVVEAYRSGNKLILFGNGGSAADAQHLAAEMCGRFLVDRRPLPALALADNTAALTAIGNDYSFDNVFARQVEGHGRAGDVAIGITTSGTSRNVIAALEVARREGLVTVALTGESPGPLETIVDYWINVPSTVTPRIQEAHTLLGHTLCELVEGALFDARPA